MDQRDALLKDIEAFIERAGMARSTFGRLAVNDGKFVDRIAAGGGLTVRTVERVRAFIQGADAQRAA
jgi:hypothetical protein